MSSVPIIGPAMKAPPFRLPGEHFAAATVFLATGAVGIVLVAPQLTAGAFPAPGVIGVTHLFTLGWITTSIMGALYQFLPVALGEPIRSVRAAHLTFGLYVLGLPFFVYGVAAGHHAATMSGAGTFGAGILVFVANVAVTLSRATRRDVTWWALAGALVFLVITLVLGFTLAGNLWKGYLGTGRFMVLGVHLHIALGGWVLLVIVGVAQKLLPMFLLSHGVGDRLARAAVALIAAGATWLALLHHLLSAALWRGAAVLMGAGLACFLAQAVLFYRHRHRPALDPGMRLAAAGLGLLGLGLALAGPVVLLAVPPRIWTAYVMSMLLGISIFVAALYYKIVPFLVWYHRFGPLAGKQSVPKVGELYSWRVANAAGILLFLGAIGTTASVLIGQSTLARSSAVVLMAGAFVEAWQMLQLARRQP